MEESVLRQKREMVEEKVTVQYGGDEGSGNFQLHCAGNGGKLRQMSLQNPTLKLLQTGAQKDFSFTATLREPSGRNQ